MNILNYFTVIAGVLGVVYFGYLISDMLVPTINMVEKTALGYILGLGIFTLILFLTNIVGIPFMAGADALLLLSVIVISYGIRRYIVKLRRTAEKSLGTCLSDIRRRPVYDKLIFIVLLILLVTSLLLSLYWPINTWDALVLYDFRAKSFVATGFMTDAIQRGYFFGYPLMTSLSHTWVYLTGGTNPLFVYSLFYISFITIFYFECRRRIGTTTSLIATFFIAIYPSYFSHSLTPYTNLPYTVYLVIGSIYLFNWINSKRGVGEIILAALLIGLSTWTRSVEPFWLTALAVVLIYSILRRRLLHLLIYTVLFSIIQWPWALFQHHFTGQELPSQELTMSLGLIPKQIDVIRIWTVIVYVFNIAIKPSLPLYLALFLIFILSVKIKRNLAFPVFLIIILNLAFLFGGTYVATYAISGWNQIPDSFSRLVMFFPALILYYVFQVLFDKKTFALFLKDKSSKQSYEKKFI